MIWPLTKMQPTPVGMESKVIPSVDMALFAFYMLWLTRIKVVPNWCCIVDDFKFGKFIFIGCDLKNIYAIKFNDFSALKRPNIIKMQCHWRDSANGFENVKKFSFRTICISEKGFVKGGRRHFSIQRGNHHCFWIKKWQNFFQTTLIECIKILPADVCSQI